MYYKYTYMFIYLSFIVMYLKISKGFFKVLFVVFHLKGRDEMAM